tara:strand:- start:5 stop:1051 length:1047 start_codon:yes stop_codon:yes gene_type:complete
MSDPIKFTAELPEGGILKENTAAGVANQNYGPTSATGWYNGLRTGDYTIIKAQDGESPLIYSPGSDAEVIQFCNTTISPSPSSTITTIDEALDFISTSDYMLFHGTDTIDNFPVGLPMDGLSSYLDSQINASTDVTGEWKDVSGNGLCFYIYGTQLSLTSLGGYQAFQFNDSGYYQCNDKHGVVNIGGDCTIVMWVWCTSIASRDTIFEKAGNGGTSYQCSVAITWETSEAFSYYSRKTPAYDYAGTSACDTNGGEGAWTMMAIKMSTGLTSTSRTGFYSKNGANFAASYTSRSDTALVRGQQIRVGYGYAGPVEGSNGIGALLTYNKMLSNTEISDVYNATKGRYGL